MSGHLHSFDSVNLESLCRQIAAIQHSSLQETGLELFAKAL